MVSAQPPDRLTIAETVRRRAHHYGDVRASHLRPLLICDGASKRRLQWYLDTQLPRLSAPNLAVIPISRVENIPDALGA